MRTKRDLKLTLASAGLGVLVWACLVAMACSCLGADMVKGYTFLPTDRVTSTKLNNLVDAGYISTAFYTLKTPFTAPIQADTALIYSSAASDFRKVTLDYLLYSNTNIIALQTEDTTPATNDMFLSLDVSAPGLKKVSLNSFYTNDNLIATRTNWATADPTNTYFLAVNAGNWAKQNPTNIVWSAAPRFVSSATALSLGNFISATHGLAGKPQYVRAVLVCVATEKGYAVGDEADIESATMTASANATTVYLSTSTVTPSILDRNSNTKSAITAVKWNAKIYAQFWF